MLGEPRHKPPDSDSHNLDGTPPDSLALPAAVPALPAFCLGVAGFATLGFGPCSAGSGGLGTWARQGVPQARNGAHPRAVREPSQRANTKLRSSQPTPRVATLSHCVPRSRVSPRSVVYRQESSVSPRFRCWCWRALPTGPTLGRCYPGSEDRSPRRSVPTAQPACQNW